MKTQILSAAAAITFIPFLTSCERSQAQPVEPVKKSSPYQFSIIRVPMMGGDALLDSFVEKGWEPISIGGVEGSGNGVTTVLLRRPK